jgi:hypothetical protein
MSVELRGPFLGVLLIVSSLMRRRFPGANDSRPRSPFREADNQELLVGRVPDDQFSPFVSRMIRIVENAGKRIGKYSQSLFEQDAMFLEILFCLLRPTRIPASDRSETTTTMLCCRCEAD